MFVISRRAVVKSSVFWAQRCKKHESQMQGCVVSWWSYHAVLHVTCFSDKT